MNNITVIRTKRKTISIKVNNDLTVTVRAPIFTSGKEIGEIFDKSENWARVNYFRAKTKIRKVIEDENNENNM